MDIKTWTTEVGGRTLTVEHGRFAQQADGSVLIRYGETAILVTAVMDSRVREGVSYFPLRVDYEEKFYAAGKIKGSRWIKREGRPTDGATLNARVIDRTLRPLFSHYIRNDIQVVATVLSYDNVNDPTAPAVFGASLAVAISRIPWNGPVSAVSLEHKDGEWIINPEKSSEQETTEELGHEHAYHERHHILLTGSESNINMIEVDAHELSEEELLKGLEKGHSAIKELTAFQQTIIDEIGVEKAEPRTIEPTPEIRTRAATFLTPRFKELHKGGIGKKEFDEGHSQLKDELIDHLTEEFGEEPSFRTLASMAYEDLMDAFVHDLALNENSRVDGRAFDEVRPLSSEVGLFSQTHGSALFSRGETQALTVATLGAPGAEQWFDEMTFEGRKRYMHHYNFPPYSVGEAGRMMGASRRDIGHGALAEKALQSLIPTEESFPYTIRVVSEILSSNGSSSMASVCGSSLALMDAGVPIKAPAAGIAMGVITNSDGSDYRILTDIQGPEDHFGDMDFKVAGTEKGITAVQLDIKMSGVSIAILKDGLNHAKKARLHILEAMKSTIAEPRKELSPIAPRVEIITVNPDRIRDIIGPGGKMIHAIQDETGTSIDIEDDGRVFITGKRKEGAERALQWVKDLTREVEVGEEFTGKVKTITDFGAFIGILPGQDGLVHISELAPYRVNRVEDILSEGDEVSVKVKSVDERSKKVGLTMIGIKQSDAIEAKRSQTSASARETKRPPFNRSGNSKKD